MRPVRAWLLSAQVMGTKGNVLVRVHVVYCHNIITCDFLFE